MRTHLYRRMEALERATAARRETLSTMVFAAMRGLRSEDLELLISAFRAERAGKSLTEHELVARQAYAAELNRRCREAGLPTGLGFARTPEISDMIETAALCRFFPEGLRALKGGMIALQRGCNPAEQEMAVLQTYASHVRRFRQIAGLVSSEESDRDRPQRGIPL